MTYNLTAVAENATGVVTLLQGVNVHVMDGWLGTMMLISFTAIIAMSAFAYTNDTRKTILVTMYSGMMVGVLFWITSLIPTWLIFLYVVGLGISLAFTYTR